MSQNEKDEKIVVPISHELKEKAEKMYEEYDLDLEEAVGLLLEESVEYEVIPSGVETLDEEELDELETEFRKELERRIYNSFNKPTVDAFEFLDEFREQMYE